MVNTGVGGTHLIPECRIERVASQGMTHILLSIMFYLYSFSLVHAFYTVSFHTPLPAGKMNLEFLENPSSTLLGYSRISNLFQAYFWDFL